jgi:glutamine cyclotransferase
MNKKSIITLAAAIMLIWSCKHKEGTANISLSPEAGASYKQGEKVTIKATYPADLKVDSIVYLLDSAKVGLKKDSTALTLATDTLGLGARLLTAKVYYGGTVQETSTNFTLLAAKAPQMLTYSVEKVFPHDTSSYTEGLVYKDGFLYESDGGYGVPPPGMASDGQSSLRKVEITTGKPVQNVLVDPKVFAEGISIVGNKIVQLTYKEKIGYVYDATTFKLLNTFQNNVGIEGWGMCFDGTKLYMDDSTNRIWLMDKDTYRAIGYIDVYDDKGPVNQINELEYIDGKLYANIYQTNDIIVIDPKTGAVLQKIDMTNLYPQNIRAAYADVLNGIAWDPQGKRLFVTGKKWPKLYQIKIGVPAP